jgi:hypothetical protein
MCGADIKILLNGASHYNNEFDVYRVLNKVN